MAIAIVDCNNFYASCERVFNPRMNGKPIVVLSNNDGVVVALSKEAKELGIENFSPLFKIREIIEKHDVQVFSSNYTLYGDISQRIMTALEQFAPDVEVYSIDEAFLFFDGFKTDDLTEHCREIRRKILKWIGIPVSIGIAETKTLSKIANRRAKKNPRHDGVLNLIDNPEFDLHLKHTPVGDVWGVGRQYTKLLISNGVKTAYDLARANRKWVKQKMTIMGLRTVLELNGTRCIRPETQPPPKKAIVSSRSFGKYVTDISEIREAVATYTARAAEKLRSQKSAAGIITVFLRTNPFKDSPQYHNGCQSVLPVPSDFTNELTEYALKCVDQIYKPGYLYQKAGVMLTNIVASKSSQYALFDAKDRMKLAKLTETVDKINAKMGGGTLYYAVQGANKQWRMKREMKSPNYTTRWNEIPKVIAKD